jgi:hypothetical protein
MDDRTPDQEQKLVNAEMRISRSRLRVSNAFVRLDDSDDRVRDAAHRAVGQNDDDLTRTGFGRPTARFYQHAHPER